MKKLIEPWNEFDEFSGCWWGFAGMFGFALLVIVAVLAFTGLVAWELVQWVTTTK